jgi:hypothetical protein
MAINTYYLLSNAVRFRQATCQLTWYFSEATVRTDNPNATGSNKSSIFNELNTDKIFNLRFNIVSSLQSTLNILNDFCSDIQHFSYAKLAALRLPGITLQVNAKHHELTFVISSEEHYQTLLWYLTPDKRIYQLLAMHFNKIHIGFGVQYEPVSNSIYLQTIPLHSAVTTHDLRDVDKLGAKLRRTLNVALQGHIGVLQLTHGSDFEHLEALWQRGRIEQLIQKYNIVPFDDGNERIVKFWRPRALKSHEQVVIVVE